MASFERLTLLSSRGGLEFVIFRLQRSFQTVRCRIVSQLLYRIVAKVSTQVIKSNNTKNNRRNEYVFSHGHYWKSWGRYGAASAEARRTGASTCAQSRESGEVGRPRRGVGGWRLERRDSHSGGPQRC